MGKWPTYDSIQNSQFLLLMEVSLAISQILAEIYFVVHNNHKSPFPRGENTATFGTLVEPILLPETFNFAGRGYDDQEARQADVTTAEAYNQINF